MMALVVRDERPDRLNEPPLSDGAWKVIQLCWAMEPGKRPKMKDVIDSLIAMLISQSISLSTDVPSPAISTFSTTSVRRPRFLLRLLY
jgi:hypothetical protein